jgi:hypothetical protein
MALFLFHPVFFPLEADPPGLSQKRNFNRQNNDFGYKIWYTRWALYRALLR